MSKIKLGVIGAGIIWDITHKHKLEKLKDIFEIKAFSVRSEENQSKLRKEFPTSEIFDNYQDLIKLDYIDAIVILTPIKLNAKVTIDALKAKKNVIVEKPLATDRIDIKKIIQLENETQKKVFVLEQFRYNENLIKLKQVLNTGKIGKLVSYELVNHRKLDGKEHNGRGFGNTSWRIEPEFPLGTLFDRGIHIITMLSFLFSKPLSVYAIGTEIRHGFGDYDHIIMMFAHHSGINGTLSFADYMDGNHNYFIIRGTEGTILYEQDRIVISGNTDERLELHPIDESFVMWQKCASWLSENDNIVYGSKETLEDVEILLAVNRSLISNEKVVMD